MFRSGFLLSISGPAALLTILVQPTVQQTADHWLGATAAPMVRQAALPGQRVASTAISPIRLASIARPVNRANSTASNQPARTASEKETPKVRRLMREGCEGAISSLAGPEARRMLPGRCIS